MTMMLPQPARHSERAPIQIQTKTSGEVLR
jgi:hypothetical protein